MCAILAVGVLLAPARPAQIASSTDDVAEDAVHVKDPPVRVDFRLADGVKVSGHLSQWSSTTIDGSFGPRRWEELRLQDVWRLYGALMDRDSVDHWLDLARLMLLMDNGERNAEQAFHRAKRLDATIEERIAAIRKEAADVLRSRADQASELEDQRLATESPESASWEAAPWPALSDEEQAAAVDTMREDAEGILSLAGLDIEPIETEFFLFYSDMPRRDTARWAVQLDNMYGRLLEIFDLPRGTNLFWGKAVIFAFNERDQFALVEAQAFNQLVPRSVAGLCHFRGPQVFINFYRQPDDHRFAALLVHETVHGFMHRYRTPQRLPTWANEGFAEYLASVTFDNSPVDRGRRGQGLDFIRNGGDIEAILDMSYVNGTWPGPNSIGYNIGYLLVELMIRDRAPKFGAWVRAIKAGKPWEQALIEDFGVDRKALVERFVAFYMVND